MTVQRFPFAFADRYRRPLALLGVHEGSAYVELTDGELRARYGPWTLRTPRANVAGAEITGPYQWWKAIGPHLSAADRGVTLGTTPDRGVCVRFRTPVRCLEPFGLLKHPGATFTVRDPEGLRAALGRRPRP
ncbi:hypothetical protein [Actinomadura macrotermitis]|uniref:Uncharacterized protein n=1 Tax=Actinomadura macrotermitis TaxID=2585200 RepID=A0A7K0BSJ8_9ACTN|nr:hypothetical protein [Actinomadura macrotermitis]MQY04160.1 hypothetical protein [Actinomadura macrotermitis]